MAGLCPARQAEARQKRASYRNAPVKGAFPLDGHHCTKTLKFEVVDNVNHLCLAASVLGSRGAPLVGCGATPRGFGMRQHRQETPALHAGVLYWQASRL